MRSRRSGSRRQSDSQRTVFLPFPSKQETPLDFGRSSMRTAISADGTKIAFDQTGQGPPVILVVGAFNERSTGAPLAEALESQLTVLNYDRRGRRASGDTQPYAVEREVEDLDALIREAGGTARVFGYSSGATLALEAAACGLNI